MAPVKHVAEAPRAFITCLTTSRATVTPSQINSFSTKQQLLQRQNPLGRQLYTLAFSPYSSTSLSATPQETGFASTAARRASACTTTITNRPSVEPLSNPIRYNGVYVAAFKAARRAFHASAIRQRDHHFDTLKFVQRLKDEGFSEEQATAMMRVLNDVIQESIQNLTRTMVLKEG